MLYLYVVIPTLDRRGWVTPTCLANVEFRNATIPSANRCYGSGQVFQRFTVTTVRKELAKFDFILTHGFNSKQLGVKPYNTFLELALLGVFRLGFIE
jgi:glutamyl/glutaminyl-tRNA synthetase